MLDLENVTKKYGPLTALRDVSFHVEKNETVGLLGRNGAGKTTLLNLVTGYLPPTAGKIRISGKDLREDPAACKRMIGYLPEKPPLYDEMTVESYLRFVCELREVKKQSIRAHVDEIISLCGLPEVRTRLLGHLSRGYRQRAGIAQALCGAPELLILDEPTVGLDPKQTVEIRELIRALSREHTVIFSSHILSEVRHACSRVLILDEGKLVTDWDARKPRGESLTLRLSVAGDRKTVLDRLRRLEPFTAAELLPPTEPRKDPVAESRKDPVAEPRKDPVAEPRKDPVAESRKDPPAEASPEPRKDPAPEASPAAPAEPRNESPAEFRVTVPRGENPGEAMDRAFRALAESGLKVRMMREEREDLEELFLSAIAVTKTAERF